MVAMCIVVGLLHVGVMQPDHQPTVVADSVAMVAATCLVAGLRPVRRAFREALCMARFSFKSQQLVTCATNGVCVDDIRPHDWLLAVGLFSLRAPPG